jgi:hypothetical protein
VVLDSSGNHVETAANLSDLERALVLAKSSNAEALLQIIEIGWSRARRAFVQKGDRLREISIGTTVEGSKLVRVTESVFRFQARLINVDNGEIVMSIDVSQGTSRAISEPETIDVQMSPLQGATTSEIDTDDPERRREVVTQVMDSFLVRLSSNGRLEAR